MEAAAEEEALRLLHAHEYDGGLALEAVAAAAPPPSRAPWTAAQVLSFDSGLLSHGKNFSLIAQSVGRCGRRAGYKKEKHAHQRRTAKMVKPVI